MQLQKGVIGKDLESVYNNYFQFPQSTFSDYLVHGGYPRALNEMNSSTERRIKTGFFFDVSRLLLSDCVAAGLDQDNLKRLLNFLLTPAQLSNPVDFLDSQIPEVDENAKPKSNFKLKSYIDYLRTTYSFFFSYREGKDCQPNYLEKQKMYVLDPFLYHSLCSLINTESDPFQTAMDRISDNTTRGLIVESVVASHLLFAQDLFYPLPSVDHTQVLMYYREGDREIDFVLCVAGPRGKQRFLIESKYSSTVSGLNKIPVNRIVLTKDILDVKGKDVLIPVSIFLLLF